MDSLPPELVTKVAWAIPDIPDLMSLRLVGKRYAAVASRPLFEMLRFSGSRQDEYTEINIIDPEIEYAVANGRVGRTKTVKFSTIPEAVDELLAYQSLSNVKTFVFDPAYYHDTFWQHYREYIGELLLGEPMDELVDVLDIDWEGEDEINAEIDEDGDECPADEVLDAQWDRDVEHALERRQTRPEREAPIIDAAEAAWNVEIVKQKENEEGIVAALCKLFGAMKALDKVQIMPWVFDGSILFPGLGYFKSDNVDFDGPSRFQITFLFEILAQALCRADRKVKSLDIVYFNAEHLNDTHSTQHVFTGLESIAFKTGDDDEWLADRAPRSDVLCQLFKCAQPTLKHFSFGGGGKYHTLPSLGGHSLLKMMSAQPDETPLVFPRLESICLKGFILNSTSLVRLLREQPCLKSLEFDHIYLSTPGTGWSAVAQALPASVREWKVSNVGHEPLTSDENVSYNWIARWDQELPDSVGWKATRHGEVTHFTRLI